MRTIKIEIKWAVIFSLMTLLWMLLEKLTGLHSTHIDKHAYISNLFAIPAILIYVLALKDKKKNFYNGQISYRQGITSGIILSVIIALLYPLVQWIISYVITPEYFPNAIAYSLETGYYKTQEEAETFFNFKSYVIFGAVWALFMGIITSLIVMLFLKSKKS
ncbi:MAG: DUF4199 domain-containing protein [Flavobacteriaceae bacterium]